MPISHHKVIYELLDSIRESMVDLLPMTEHHTDIGQATVRQVGLGEERQMRLLYAWRTHLPFAHRCSSSQGRRKTRLLVAV